MRFLLSLVILFAVACTPMHGGERSCSAKAGKCPYAKKECSACKKKMGEKCSCEKCKKKGASCGSASCSASK